MSRVRTLPPTERGAENPDSASAGRENSRGAGRGARGASGGAPTRPGRPGEQKAGWGPRPPAPSRRPGPYPKTTALTDPVPPPACGARRPRSCLQTDGRTDGPTAPGSAAQRGPSAGPLAPPIVKGPAGRFRVQSQRRATRGPAAANRVSRYSGVGQSRPIRTRDTAGSGGAGQSALGAGPRCSSRPRCNARWRGLAGRWRPGLLAASSLSAGPG